MKLPGTVDQSPSSISFNADCLHPGAHRRALSLGSGGEMTMLRRHHRGEADTAIA